MQKEEAKLYIGILKKKNKFHLTTSFETVFASLKKMAEKATDINGLFKELKFQELMTSQSMEELSGILTPMLAQLKKLSSAAKDSYDPKRLYQLIEVLSKDISIQIHRILSQENLMFSSFADFKGWQAKAQEIFNQF